MKLNLKKGASAFLALFLGLAPMGAWAKTHQVKSKEIAQNLNKAEDNTTESS